MNLLTNYERAKQAIYNHVGFTEDWVIYPIYDLSEMYWKSHVNEKGYGHVEYANTMKNVGMGDGYSAEIYTQRFYEKWVYSGLIYTMIFIDPQVDGMKYFAIFDNALQIK